MDEELLATYSEEHDHCYTATGSTRKDTAISTLQNGFKIYILYDPMLIGKSKITIALQFLLATHHALVATFLLGGLVYWCSYLKTTMKENSTSSCST